jgi:peptide/nickel transport system substrate-binding protein
MCAMNTTLALDYYRPGTASQIYWPMSMVSWAYPEGDDGNASTDNGKDYPQLNGRFDLTVAKNNIQKYMEEAGVSAGDPSLSITFTIAGSNLQDHPTYKTFRDAAALLNSMGWDIDVIPDTQALTKLSTGSLEVWAAAWGSAIDPDMYQVYHKNSSTTSTLAWGYPSLKASGSSEEKQILNELSELIDAARETLDQNERAAIYEQAMSKVLDLAIELPVYQRSVIYAYNSKVINADSLPSEGEMNPYSSPLDRIWELEFAK